MRGGRVLTTGSSGSGKDVQEVHSADTELKLNHHKFSTAVQKTGTCESETGADNVDATFTNVYEAETHHRVYEAETHHHVYEADGTDDRTILMVSSLLVGVVFRDTKLYYLDPVKGEVGTIWDDSTAGLSVFMWMRRPMVHKFMVCCVNLQVLCTLTTVPAGHWLPAWAITLGSITSLLTIAAIWIYMLLRLRYTWPTRAHWIASKAREPWWQIWIVLMLIWETVSYVLFYFDIGVETVRTWHDEMRFSRQLCIAAGFLRASLIVYFYDSVHTPRHLYPCTCTHCHVCLTYISATAFSHRSTILEHPTICTCPCMPWHSYIPAFVLASAHASCWLWVLSLVSSLFWMFYPWSHPSPGCSQVRKLVPILVAIVLKMRYMAAFILCSFVAHFMILEASATGVKEESTHFHLGEEDDIWDGMWQLYIAMTTANNPGQCPPVCMAWPPNSTHGTPGIAASWGARTT